MYSRGSGRKLHFCDSCLRIILTSQSGIGLETCILFAKEGANVLMADISSAALDKASEKLKQLVPSAHKVDIKVPILLPKLDTLSHD